MRFHVLGLPHTVTSEEYVACAFTQKVLKFIRMWRRYRSEDHIIHYGHVESKTDAQEHVAVMDNDVLQRTYGGYDWRKEQFKHSANDLAAETFALRAAAEIGVRKQPNDFILAFWGGGCAKAASMHPDLITVEPGIGSGSAWAKWRCYESEPLRSAHVGTAGVSFCDPKWYWTVIPNYFDINDFDATQPRENWALYIGRLGVNKGLNIAIDACKRAGIQLVVAGQGEAEFLKSQNLTAWPSHVNFIGYADLETRKKLMARAKFGFLLSTYWEPFGGTMVEMQLSGCVPIVSDAGAMTEIIMDEVNGFRCSNMGDILRAIRNVDTINRNRMVAFARANFSLEAVAPRFERYFLDVLSVYEKKGWYEDHNRELGRGWQKGLNYAPLYAGA
jgi:glycosyltransferase involved in cell wall biosynthesis